MTETVTAAQMRAIEQAAMDRGDVAGLDLMERAGQGVVDAVLAQWPAFADGPQAAAVLCGPGNNGGDGFVVARLLTARGWDVTVFLMGGADALPPDAKANHDRWRAMGAVHPYNAATLMEVAKAHGEAGVDTWLIVDALFGIGQRPPMDAVLDPVNRMIDATFGYNAGPAPVFVAIDLPTGYDADTGNALARRPMPCDLIVTFHARKRIHEVLQDRGDHVVVVDIGL